MSESIYRKILRRRLSAVIGGREKSQAKPKRVQKNLTISEIDADRMVSLAQRDGQSQAQLLSAALDCYEDCFGSAKTSEGQ